MTPDPAVGRAAEAIPELTRAVQLQPDLAEAHNNLGVLLAEAGRPVAQPRRQEVARVARALGGVVVGVGDGSEPLVVVE